VVGIAQAPPEYFFPARPACAPAHSGAHNVFQQPRRPHAFVLRVCPDLLVRGEATGAWRAERHAQRLTFCGFPKGFLGRLQAVQEALSPGLSIPLNFEAIENLSHSSPRRLRPAFPFRPDNPHQRVGGRGVIRREEDIRYHTSRAPEVDP